MKDETYCFIQDVRDRKRVARGANNKVRGGGRTVKLPADYMTRKERQSLNGEVTTYPMNRPVPWAEYKEWPDDIKAQYQGGLIIKYGASADAVGQMMGVSARMVAFERKRLGIKAGSGNRVKKKAWAAFLQPEQEEPEPEPEEPQAMDIAELIRALAGTGARLTIEVTL